MDNYIEVIERALQDENVTISVGDRSVCYHDLEHSRVLKSIVQACEDTDEPIVDFYLEGDNVGSMSVLVGYDDESISDYVMTGFLLELMYRGDV